MSEIRVIDASVGIKLFVAEPDSVAAERLFARPAQEPDTHFYVPDLFYVECANILWKYVYRFQYPVEEAQKDLNNLRLLALRAVRTTELLAEALALSASSGITVYDACYGALARALDAPLITADARLANHLKRFDYDVRLLHELP